MTVPLRTWRRSALYTVSAANVASALAGFKAAIDAEVAANSTTAKWQVADSSVPNGTLVLKRTANGTGGQGRIMLFGGQSPHTTAVDAATIGATQLYIGFAESAAVDAPEQSYTAGVPFTTGQWLAGGILTGTFTGVDRCEYYETEDGVCFILRSAAMTAATANLATGFAGHLGVSLDNNTAYGIAWGSAGLWAGNQDISTTTVSSIWAPNGSEGTASSARCNYLETSLGARRCRRDVMFLSTSVRDALRDSGSRRYFKPLLLPNSDQIRTNVKMRQIALGISEVHGQTMSNVDGVQAHHIGSRSDAVDGGPWLVNFYI